MHVHGEYRLMKINFSMTIFNIKHFVVSISFTTFVLQLKDIILTTKKYDIMKEALQFLLDNLSLTLKEAKQHLLNTVEFGSSDISYSNVSLMYTDNDNYAGGVKNNKGRGFYISYKGGDTFIREHKLYE